MAVTGKNQTRPTDAPLSAIAIAAAFGALAWTGIVDVVGWGGVPDGLHAGLIVGGVASVLLCAQLARSQLRDTARHLTPLAVGLDTWLELSVTAACASLVAAALAAVGFLMAGSFGDLLAAAALPASLFALVALAGAGVVVGRAGDVTSGYFVRAVGLAVAWPLVIGGLAYVAALSLFLVVPKPLLIALASLLGVALVLTLWALRTDDTLSAGAALSSSAALLPTNLQYSAAPARFTATERTRHMRRLMYQLVLPPVAAIAGLYALASVSFVATLTPPMFAFVGAAAGLFGLRRLATVLLTDRGVVIRRRTDATV